MEIDFMNNKCSFSITGPLGTKFDLTLQYILRGFFIQYDEQSYGFFAYREPKRK